jgi:alkanesulfonate monooxygenase SsuD/methylene tetrahydromethanopterin reductase-like flavin-dependent oxidoreductase (luciferase family)
MKFQVLDIIPHLKNPVTGAIVSTADRLNQVVQTARRAEEFGYDSFSVGERHAGEFISSSRPPRCWPPSQLSPAGSGCRAA